ncbi:MAG: hypothetical protein IPL84_03865 [Chitinophagaceae bacterium]|nr:hypothetical protein [Chitinophagaceae bacterium]
MAKGFCDALKFHPASFPFQSDWWLAKGEFAWNNRTWLEANIFSFISDGWHLFDAIRIVSLLLIVALLLTENKRLKNEIDNNLWLAVTLFLIFGYIIHGSIFEIVFKIL